MKLLQLNIWAGKLGDQIIDLLNTEQPDVVCLQEVSSYAGDPGAYFASMEEIQKHCDLKFSFLSPVFSFKFMSDVIDFGNAILTRQETSGQNTVFTSLEYKSNFDFSHDDYNVRNFQHATLILNDKKFNVINHHGFHIRHNKDGNRETDRQMKMISDYINELDGPVILTGDFNLHPESKSLKPLNNQLSNLSIKYELKTTRNELTYKTEVCDYILVNEGVKVNNFYMAEKIVSDHQALILEFDL